MEFKMNAMTLEDVVRANLSGETADDYLVQRLRLATARANILKAAGAHLVMICHGAAHDAGWWTDIVTGEPIVRRPHVVGEKLMLIVSEVAEAMEGHRKSLMDDKLPHRPMIEVELADAVIRIADLAGALGIDLGGAIAEKMAFNATRPDHKPENRKLENGKKY